MRILVVEDEASMLRLLRDGLREHGHTVMTASDGEDGLQLAAAHQFDVVVLDVLLPGIDGFEVAQRLREADHDVAILMLTACDSQEEIIEGLDRGADDYLTKPFAFRELLARIKSVTRRPAAGFAGRLCIDDLVFDCSHHAAFRAGRPLDLTRTELALLRCLMKSAGSTVARSSLVQAVWGGANQVGNSTLDAFMNLLRNKIDVPFGTRLLYTVRGVGYGIRPSAEALALGQRAAG